MRTLLLLLLSVSLVACATKLVHVETYVHDEIEFICFYTDGYFWQHMDCEQLKGPAE